MGTEAGTALRDSPCFYALEDYAAFAPRLIALHIDLLIVFTLWAMITPVVMAVFFDPLIAVTVAMLTLAVLSWVYFIELERSSIGTIGFRLLGLKVVDLRGGTPTRTQMLVRIAFGIVGPFNILLDHHSMHADDNRQSLRDKLAGTYVVRRRAQTAGHGSLSYSRYFIDGTSWVVEEVERRQTTEDPPQTP